jgi:flagellar biogenesis protein FliO
MDAARTSFTLPEVPSVLARLWAAVQDAARIVKVGRRERSLRVCESLSLGERRSLIVVQFDEKRFLVGVTSQSIALLQRLDDRAASPPAPEDPAASDSSRSGTN